MDDPRSTTESLNKPPIKKPVGVYVIAAIFTAVWLFSVGSVLYVVLFKFSPEMRHRLMTTAAAAPLGIAELNGLLTMVGSWLLVGLRRIGAGLLLASTLLVLGLGMITWPVLLQTYLNHRNPALLHPLLLGGANLVLHVAATAYAFHLNRRGLLR